MISPLKPIFARMNVVFSALFPHLPGMKPPKRITDIQSQGRHSPASINAATI